MTNNTSLPCDIVQDLLPSYVDGILSDTGTSAVANHLQSCKSCQDIYNSMITDVPHQHNADQQEKEIDYLKKVRSKTRHFTVTAILIAVLLAASGTAVYFLIFSGEYILNSVKYNLQVSSTSLKIEGILPDDFTTGTQKIEEKDGVISLTLPAKKKTFLSFHKNYNVSYTSATAIREVRVNGDILWQDGTSITAYVNRVYKGKHPYIGSASDNVSLALALGVEDSFGGFTSKLQTSKQPYDWTICLSEPQTAAEEILRKKMTTYAYAILALIDNVDSITWQYSDASAQAHTYTITTDEANKRLGSDIKKTAESICDFQKFTREIGLE